MQSGEFRWIPFSEAVAKLALWGDVNSVNQLLSLLASGAVSARGDVHFATFQAGQLLVTDEQFIDIPAAKWAELISALENPGRRPILFCHLFPGEVHAPLGKLDLANNGFQLASQSLFNDTGDYETWISVRDVHILDVDLVRAVPAKSQSTVRLVNSKSVGGRPPKADWEQALIHLFGKIYRDGWKPETIEEVNSELQNWLVNEGADVSDTASRERARALFRALKAWDAAEN
jgi:hypothetical protein